MNDLELFKSITRAVTGVASDDASIAKAVAAVRALFVPAHAAERIAHQSHDRKERGGRDRSE